MSNFDSFLRSNKKLRVVSIFAFIFLSSFLLPEEQVIPVQGATINDWNHDTFWYGPWGKSGVHKGIDIFAQEGQPVIASTYGVVIYRNTVSMGGNVVVVLGPKWRFHYYAHLKQTTNIYSRWVRAEDQIGEVGNTGNAIDRPFHLHYSIVTLLPYPWRWDSSTQGWKKMFFLNPSNKLFGN